MRLGAEQATHVRPPPGPTPRAIDVRGMLASPPAAQPRTRTRSADGHVPDEANPEAMDRHAAHGVQPPGRAARTLAAALSITRAKDAQQRSGVHHDNEAIPRCPNRGGV